MRLPPSVPSRIRRSAVKNFTSAADGELNIATEPVDKEINYALCCGYSFGGQTAALVIKKYEDSI
ncbi:MAG: hypothetical protein ACYS8S_08285 [Planctomycetota bacterium]|jgi:3-oxoacyl-(acyl-carrier-protein) synthase